MISDLLPALDDAFHVLSQHLETLLEEEVELRRQQAELKQEQEDLAAEKQQFEDDLKTAEEQFALPEDIIDLNVGGGHFTTLKSTLRSVPSTMLNSMFSGRWRIVRDRTGRAFIDRDPTLFRMVLNGLRRGAVWPTSSNPEERDNLARELDYFGLVIEGLLCCVPLDVSLLFGFRFKMFIFLFIVHRNVDKQTKLHLCLWWS